VITGGDSGIGRAVAVAFAREGADVLLSYLAEEQGDAERTAELVREAGREVVLVAGEVGDDGVDVVTVQLGEQSQGTVPA
jgi:NAD(P)-dependent dehydrogenase (short-subunit alcohol dehydrogenase family)